MSSVSSTGSSRSRSSRSSSSSAACKGDPSISLQQGLFRCSCYLLHISRGQSSRRKSRPRCCRSEYEGPGSVRKIVRIGIREHASGHNRSLRSERTCCVRLPDIGRSCWLFSSLCTETIRTMEGAGGRRATWSVMRGGGSRRRGGGGGGGGFTGRCKHNAPRFCIILNKGGHWTGTECVFLQRRCDRIQHRPSRLFARSRRLRGPQ